MPAPVTPVMPRLVEGDETPRMSAFAEQLTRKLMEVLLSVGFGFRPSSGFSALAIDAAATSLFRELRPMIEASDYIAVPEDADDCVRYVLANRWIVFGLENLDLEWLGLRPRLRNLLHKIGIVNVQMLVSETVAELLTIPGLGSVMLAEIVSKLDERDLALPAKPEEIQPHYRHIRHFAGLLTKCGCIKGGGWLAACRAGIVNYGNLVAASEDDLARVFGRRSARNLAAAVTAT